jgi:hypothetical protein
MMGDRATASQADPFTPEIQMDAKSNEETLFNAARTLSDPRQRAAFLDAACRGASDLRQKLEALLSADAKADAYFGQIARDPEMLTTEAVLTGPPEMHPLLHETASDRIGRYRLLEKVGEGGCGVVHVAEQTEPVRRRVALKIIKLGMDTRDVVARFEAERQACVQLIF